MKGYRTSKRDIYIFLENEECSELGKKILKGIFLDEMKNINELTLDVNDDLCRKNQEIISIKEDGIMQAHVNSNAYFKVKGEGSYEDHQGYRHVHLVDMNHEKVEFGYKGIYDKLKE